MTYEAAKAIYYINSALTMVLIHYGYSQIFAPRVKNYWIFLAYTGYLLISSLQFFQFSSPWLNLIFNTALILALSFLYAGKWGYRIIFGALIYFCSLLADSFAFSLLDRTYYHDRGIHMPETFIWSVQRSATTLFNLLLLFICIRIFKTIFQKKLEFFSVQVPALYQISILLILGGLIVFDALFVSISLEHSDINYTHIIVIQLFLGVLAMLVVCFYNASLNYIAEKVKNEAFEKEFHKWALQYYTMLESQSALRTSSHNIKYLLLGILGLLQTGKKEEAMARISEQLQQMKKAGQNAISGNIALDTILNEYEQAARNTLGIGLDLNLAIPLDMEIDPYIMSMILGNALQNAIEACTLLSETERYIKISGRAVTNKTRSLQITVKNPYSKEPMVDHKGRLITTKAEKAKHGIGLATIQESLSPAQGTVDYEYGDGVFCMRMIFNDL